MNKFEALIITGKLEVYFSGEKELFDEVKSIQKCIIDDDLINLAISLGRLYELSKSSNENVSKHLEDLISYVVESNVEIKVVESNVEIKDKTNMTVEEMDFSIRTVNCVKRAGCSTVADILKYAVEDFLAIRNLGLKSATEVIAKMKELGFQEWANKADEALREAQAR